MVVQRVADLSLKANDITKPYKIFVYIVKENVSSSNKCFVCLLKQKFTHHGSIAHFSYHNGMPLYQEIVNDSNAGSLKL